MLNLNQTISLVTIRRFDCDIILITSIVLFIVVNFSKAGHFDESTYLNKNYDEWGKTEQEIIKKVDAEIKRLTSEVTREVAIKKLNINKAHIIEKKDAKTINELTKGHEKTGEGANIIEKRKEIEQKAEALFKPMKIGDQISVNLPGRVISGKIQSISEEAITIGGVRVASYYLSKELANKLLPSKNSAEKRRYIDRQLQEYTNAADDKRYKEHEKLMNENGYFLNKKNAKYEFVDLNKKINDYIASRVNLLQTDKKIRYNIESKFFDKKSGFADYYGRWIPIDNIKSLHEAKETYYARFATGENPLKESITPNKSNANTANDLFTGTSTTNANTANGLFAGTSTTNANTANGLFATTSTTNVSTTNNKDTRPENDVLKQILDTSLVVIKTETGQGSGLLTIDENGISLYTNQHVLYGGRNISIKNIRGNNIVLREMYLSYDLDIAKFDVVINGDYDDDNILRISPLVPSSGDEVSVYGNSEGEGVVTKLTGKLLAVGPEKVETDAKFVAGNSGGPIINKEGNVIAISTYVTRAIPTWVNKDTRFTEIRRLGLRITKNSAYKHITPMSLFFTQSCYIEDIRLYIFDLAKLALWNVTFMNDFDVTVNSRQYFNKQWAYRLNTIINFRWFNDIIKGAHDSDNKYESALECTHKMTADEIIYIKKYINGQRWVSGFIKKSAIENEELANTLSDIEKTEYSRYTNQLRDTIQERQK